MLQPLESPFSAELPAVSATHPPATLVHVAASTLPTSAPALKPHILFVLADDLGWGEVGWNGAAAHLFPQGRRSLTPRLDRLASEGQVLGRHYMHMFCSPSRSAIQSGRDPIYVNVVNAAGGGYNPSVAAAGVSGGIPCGMTGLGEVMTRGGYATHCMPPRCGSTP